MYARGASLLGLGGGRRRLCNLFAFTMAFFGQGRPRARLPPQQLRLSAVTPGRRALPAVLPGDVVLLQDGGEGEEEERALSFSLAYCSLMMALIAGVGAGNGSVILSLHHMRPGPAALPWQRRKAVVRKRWTTWCCLMHDRHLHHLFPAADHLSDLSAVSPDRNDQKHLVTLRFSALNPILDPWVFILFRKAVFHNLRSSLRCCTASVGGAPEPRPQITCQGFTSSTLQARPLCEHQG
ncbi:hypothetical protein AAFF_G00280840 [Aldrovandia affinis]|uniref:Uncharacterized protein n=1 Tax=Aldrovandia affinis TaxID=143900 RepID=A0AAD7W2B5_9TELE|nr:hypothetical protein AAFF_G00280840 [Aldrovandia affinis]